jgi:hypothetical protein
MILTVSKGKGCGCGCLGQLFAVMFLFFTYEGVHGVYTALTAGEQLEMTCADFMAKKPSSKWLKLTEATVLYDKMVGETMFGKTVTQVYVPLIPLGAQPNATSRVLLASKKPEDIARAQELVDAGPDMMKQIEAAQKLFQPPNTSKVIQGTVRYGLADSDSDRRKMHQLIGNLETEYVVIEDGEKPTLWGGLTKLGYAILFLMLAGVSGIMADWLNNKDKSSP